MSPTQQRFEGKSIEDALAAAARTLGPDLHVSDARRIREGGVMGFFTRQHYEVLAEGSADHRSDWDRAIAGEELTAPPRPAATATIDRPGDGGSILDETLRLLVQRVEVDEDLTSVAEAAADEASFADLLARSAGTTIDLGAGTGTGTGTGAGRAATSTEADLRDLIDRVGAAAALLRQQAIAEETGLVPAPITEPASPAALAAGPTTETATATNGATATAATAATAATGTGTASGDAPATAAPATAAPATAAPATAATPTIAATDPTAGANGAAPAGTPQWNRDALVALGVPAEILRRLPPADPETDLDWLAALGRAIHVTLPDSGRTDQSTLTASGNGPAAAIELLRAGVQGFRPGTLQLGATIVPATPTELALAIRSLLARS